MRALGRAAEGFVPLDLVGAGLDAQMQGLRVIQCLVAVIGRGLGHLGRFQRRAPGLAAFSCGTLAS
jgi:hypothetical protein